MCKYEPYYYTQCSCISFIPTYCGYRPSCPDVCPSLQPAYGHCKRYPYTNPSGTVIEAPCRTLVPLAIGTKAIMINGKVEILASIDGRCEFCEEDRAEKARRDSGREFNVAMLKQRKRKNVKLGRVEMSRRSKEERERVREIKRVKEERLDMEWELAEQNKQTKEEEEGLRKAEEFLKAEENKKRKREGVDEGKGREGKGCVNVVMQDGFK